MTIIHRLFMPYSWYSFAKLSIIFLIRGGVSPFFCLDSLKG